jgi:uncharacterized protein
LLNTWSSREAVCGAYAQATSEHDLYGAILNAGITHFGDHLDLSWSEFKRLLDTNVSAVAQLTHLAVPYLLEKKQGGGVMLVASMAGVTPVPYQSAYSGTKAFLVAFGHGLWHELRGTEVSLTTFVPGGIATEMMDDNGLSKHFGRGGLFIQSAETCARGALQAFKRRKHTHVPGLVNQAGVLASKLLPRSFMVGQVASEYRKALAHQPRVFAPLQRAAVDAEAHAMLAPVEQVAGHEHDGVRVEQPRARERDGNPGARGVHLQRDPEQRHARREPDRKGHP